MAQHTVLLERAGMMAAASGVIANVWLGASSLYWRELAGLDPVSLVVYRVLLSLPSLLLLMWLAGNLDMLRAAMAVRVLLLHLAAAGLLGLSWGVFIWASIHGHVVESGLGYLVAPCVSMLIGVLIWLALAVLAVEPPPTLGAQAWVLRAGRHAGVWHGQSHAPQGRAGADFAGLGQVPAPLCLHPQGALGLQATLGNAPGRIALDQTYGH